MNTGLNKIKNTFNINKHYFTDLIILAIPLLIGNLGHTLIGATDILVVARYSINALAAISISNSMLFTVFIFGLGILAAISIILSNMRGARQQTKKYLASSLFFSMLLAIIFTVICYSLSFFVDRMGFDANLVPMIKQYIRIVAFSIPGMYLYEGIKQFLQSFEIVKLPNLLLLYAVVLNLILDITLVFGFGPIPAMGSKGAAIATLSVRTVMGLVLLFYVLKMTDFKLFSNYTYMKNLAKTGIPIGIALTLEFLAFNIITVLVGREEGILSAVHNIIVTITSATFMVPLSISTALAIKVAYYYGARKNNEILKYSLAGLVIGVGFMILSSVILNTYPEFIIKLFTKDTEVLKIALPVIGIGAMFQVFDGFQVVAGGILKGFKMTRVVSACVFIGYWFAGMPVAYICVYKLGYSLKGYWIALAVSLFFMGLIQAAAAVWKYNNIKSKNDYNSLPFIYFGGN